MISNVNLFTSKLIESLDEAPVVDEIHFRVNLQLNYALVLKIASLCDIGTLFIRDQAVDSQNFQAEAIEGMLLQEFAGGRNDTLSLILLIDPIEYLHRLNQYLSLRSEVDNHE